MSPASGSPMPAAWHLRRIDNAPICRTSDSDDARQHARAGRAVAVGELSDCTPEIVAGVSGTAATYSRRKGARARASPCLQGNSMIHRCPRHDELMVVRPWRREPRRDCDVTLVCLSCVAESRERVQAELAKCKPRGKGRPPGRKASDR